MRSARSSGGVVLALRWRVGGGARPPPGDDSRQRMAPGAKGHCQQHDTGHRSKMLVSWRKGGQLFERLTRGGEATPYAGAMDHLLAVVQSNMVYVTF